jgi:hypothetical protein
VTFRSPTSDKPDERPLGLREDDLAACRPAGTVHRLDVSCTPLPTALAGPSTHAFDLADTIALSSDCPPTWRSTEWKAAASRPVPA